MDDRGDGDVMMVVGADWETEVLDDADFAPPLNTQLDAFWEMRMRDDDLSPLYERLRLYYTMPNVPWSGECSIGGRICCNPCGWCLYRLLVGCCDAPEFHEWNGCINGDIRLESPPPVLVGPKHPERIRRYLLHWGLRRLYAQGHVRFASVVKRLGLGRRVFGSLERAGEAV